MIRQVITSMMTNIELHRAVRFVVGETAVPPQEMIDYGLSLGRAPETQEERDVFLALMKLAARQTPEVLIKFIKTETVNGTKVMSVDEIKLDAYIARRSLMYNQASKARRQRQQQQREKQQRHQEEMQRINQMHDLNVHAVVSAVAPGLTNGPAYNVQPDPLVTATTSPFDMMMFEGLV